jgi:hypothetical protein
MTLHHLVVSSVASSAVGGGGGSCVGASPESLSAVGRRWASLVH